MTKPEPPKISVVIPTRGRPDLLVRAIRSALAQTVSDLECIVVLDGPDPSSTAALAGIEERVRGITLPRRSGAPAARNAGVSVARGRWVAFLDDDDEWYPTKLERQLAVALASRFRWPIVACQLMCTTSGIQCAIPRRVSRPEGTLSDYLFARRTMSSGEGAIFTSSLYAPRELLTRVGFDEQLERFQDADWLLRSEAVDGAGLEIVPEPLGIRHDDGGRERISLRGSWEESLSWIRRSFRAGLVSREALASFLMTMCSELASRAGDWRGAWVLLKEGCVLGRPRGMVFAVFAAIWLLPAPVRRAVRRFVPRGNAP